jgi:hypothetical protein
VAGASTGGASTRLEGNRIFGETRFYGKDGAIGMDEAIAKIGARIKGNNVKFSESAGRLELRDNLMGTLSVDRAALGFVQGEAINGAFRLWDVAGNHLMRINNMVLAQHTILSSNFVDLSGVTNAGLVLSSSAVIAGNSSASLKNVVRYALPGGAPPPTLREGLNLVTVVSI